MRNIILCYPISRQIKWAPFPGNILSCCRKWMKSINKLPQYNIYNAYRYPGELYALHIGPI